MEKAFYVSKIKVNGQPESSMHILLRGLYGKPGTNEYNDIVHCNLGHAILYCKGYELAEDCEFEYSEVSLEEFENYSGHKGVFMCDC